MPGLKLRVLTKKIISYFSTKTYVVGSKKNRLLRLLQLRMRIFRLVLVNSPAATFQSILTTEVLKNGGRIQTLIITGQIVPHLLPKLNDIARH